MPGSLTYVGKEVLDQTKVEVCLYSEEGLNRYDVQQMKDFPLIEAGKMAWIDVDGVHDSEVVEQVGKRFNLHPLLMEDVLNTTQKPKIEFFEQENQLFVVLKMLHLDQESLKIEAEQICIVLGKDFLLSFQELDETDIFESIHDRMDRPSSRIRRNRSDYLLYALTDLIVDHYFILVDHLTTRLEDLEEAVLKDPKNEHQNQIYVLRKELSFMRRNILPVRDILNALIREDSELVGNQVNVYLRDVLDHVLRNLETLDDYRDLADNLMSNYYASISNKMNSVMKTLTVFTVIFMPLSFIAGLYGMNFVNMPELQNPNGYFFTLGGMALTALGLWLYFKWKNFI